MPNIKKLAAGSPVHAREKLLTVRLVDLICLFVYATDDTGSIAEYRPWQLHEPVKKEEPMSKAGQNESLAEEREPKKIKDSVNNGDCFFFKSVLCDDGVLVKVGVLTLLII